MSDKVILNLFMVFLTLSAVGVSYVISYPYFSSTNNWLRGMSQLVRISKPLSTDKCRVMWLVAEVCNICHFHKLFSK